MPHGNRGRPPVLGDYEMAWLPQSLRSAGGIVNRSIVIAAANSIISAHNPGALNDHGGPNVVHRHGLSPMQGTKAALKCLLTLKNSDCWNASPNLFRSTAFSHGSSSTGTKLVYDWSQPVHELAQEDDDRFHHWI